MLGAFRAAVKQVGAALPSPRDPSPQSCPPSFLSLCSPLAPFPLHPSTGPLGLLHPSVSPSPARLASRVPAEF